MDEPKTTKHIFNEDLLPHALKMIREDRVLKPGEVTGENIADGSIGGEKLLLAPVGSSHVGELEDLTIKAFEFNNAGAGWNTQLFPDAFDARPCVVCAAHGGYEVEIGEVSAGKFVYRLSPSVSDPVVVMCLAAEYGGE